MSRTLGALLFNGNFKHTDATSHIRLLNGQISTHFFSFHFCNFVRVRSDLSPTDLYLYSERLFKGFFAVWSGQLRQILQKQIHLHSRPFVLRTIGGELLHKFKFWKTMGWAHAWNHNLYKIAILYLRSPWCSPWDLSITISVTRLGYFLKGKSYCINFLDKYLKYFWILFFYPTSA